MWRSEQISAHFGTRRACRVVEIEGMKVGEAGEMYQRPTIFDFQRNLDTLIHSGEHQARAAAAHVKSDHAARGLADSTTIHYYGDRKLQRHTSGHSSAGDAVD